MRLMKQVLMMSSRQDQATNQTQISTTRVPMATKLGWMVTDPDGLLPLMLLDHLLMW